MTRFAKRYHKRARHVDLGRYPSTSTDRAATRSRSGPCFPSLRRSSIMGRESTEMLNFDRFEVLTFDCYGTLIDWESGIFSAMRPILAAHGKSLSDVEVLSLYGEFEAQVEAGEYRTYREVLRRVVELFGKQL